MDRFAPLQPRELALGKAADALAPVTPASADADALSPDAARYKAKATEAAVKFEAFFIGQMLHQMRSSTREMAGEDSIYKDSINQDMLDMADNLVADQLAGKRAFGVADAILRQLLPPKAATVAAVAPVASMQNFSATLNSSK